MAQYGEYGGPIKRMLGTQTISVPDGANISTTIHHEDQVADYSNMYVYMVITTTANTRVELGSEASGTSFLLTANDQLVSKIVSGNTLGLHGDGATATVTVQKFIS